MAEMGLALSVLPDELAVCRLEAGERIPEWAMGEGLWSITRTAEELSIVCAAKRVPPGVTRQEKFRVLKVEGPLDFSLTGVMARLTSPLGEAQVPVFVLSTYDTDYLMVRTQMLRDAVEVLRRAGHIVQE